MQMILSGFADRNDSYRLFHEFLNTWLPSGFTDIDRESPLMQKLEQVTQENNQLFFISDLIKLKILFASNRSLDMLGVDPRQLDPGIFYVLTHPEELKRHNVARTRLFNLGQQLYIDGKGTNLISTNFRFLNPAGTYTNTLVQCFLFLSEIPYRTVFMLQVNTGIPWFESARHGYHLYMGHDLQNFRLPDEKLLQIGNFFSNREFEIILLISMGLNSRQIAEQLYLSVHTVNTHRRNILKKSGKSGIIELIWDLKARGML